MKQLSDNLIKHSNQIWMVIMVIIALIGVTLEIGYIFMIPASVQRMLIGAAVFYGLVCGSVRSEKLARILELVIPIGLAILISIIIRGRIVIGFLGMINHAISLWNEQYTTGYWLIYSKQVTTADISTAFAVLILIIFVVVWKFTKKDWISVPILLLVGTMMVGLLLGRPMELAIAFGVPAIFGLWVCWPSKNIDSRKVQLTLILTIIVAVAITVQDDSALNGISKVRENIVDKAETFAYGSDTLPQGDLRKSGHMNDDINGTVRLQVTESSDKDLYLRGYVGDTYENGSWRPLKVDQENSKNRGLLKWLSNRDFKPSSQYYVYTELGDEKVDANDVSVRNISANRKYIYTPYAAETPVAWKVSMNEDKGYKTSAFIGQTKYKYSEVSDNAPAEFIHLQDWLLAPENDEQKQYLEAEKEYRNYVYEEYLDIDPVLAPMIEKIFPDDNNDETDTVYSATIKIREKMEKLVSYTKEPTDVPSDEDPIRWFVEDAGEGNSAYYASVAVMAFRSYGIPARYAEGYHLSGDGWSYENNRINLTSDDAYAWCEAYMDGIGWVPVDTVPGMYPDTYAIMQMLDSGGEVKHTSARSDSDEEANKILEERAEKQANKQRAIVEKSAHIIYGIAVVALIVFMILLLLSFLVRTIALRKFDRKLSKATGAAYVALLWGRISNILNSLDIEAKVGYNIGDTEEMVRQILPDIVPGSVVAVNKILEKFYFGGIELERYEEDHIYRFYEKLCDAVANMNWKQRYKFSIRDTWFLIFGNKK